MSIILLSKLKATLQVDLLHFRSGDFNECIDRVQNIELEHYKYQLIKQQNKYILYY